MFEDYQRILVGLALLSIVITKSYSYPDLRDHISIDGVAIEELNFRPTPRGQIATIEVLAVIEKALADHFETEQELNDHISSLYNAVNRYYVGFKDPEIRIKLVGYEILASDPGEFLVYGVNGLKTWTLGRMAKWAVKHKDTLPKHDSVFLNLKIAPYGAYGSMYQMCKKDYTVPTAYSYALEEGFVPWQLAHELGHNVGSDNCPGDDGGGYVMCHGGVNRASITGFGPDSQKQIADYLTPLLGGCISTYDATEEQLSKFNFNRTILPGHRVSLDKSCEGAQGKGTVWIKEKTTCKELWCRSPNGYEDWWMPPIGTAEPCPPGQRCYDGECKSSDPHPPGQFFT